MEKLIVDGSYTYKQVKESQKMILNLTLDILAKEKEKEIYLIKMTYGIKNTETKYKILDLSKLRNKNDLASVIAPGSFWGSGSDLESLKYFWREKADSKELVVLNDFGGKYEDDENSFIVCKNKIIILKKDSVNVYIEELYNNQIALNLGSKWYWIDFIDSGFPERFLPSIPNAEIEYKEFLEVWYSQYKNQVLLSSVLGWFIACFYINEVIKLIGQDHFPLFLVTGGTENGKTSLIANCLKFFGLNYIGSNYTTTSKFIEEKQLSQLSRIPIWRDEFRNEGKAWEKESTLRSIFNRTPFEKGSANQKQIAYKPLTTLLLTGEDYMEDPATRRRFIIFDMHENEKISKEEFLEITILASKIFPRAFLAMLKKGFDTNTFIRLVKLQLRTANAEEMEKITYAALGAVFGEALGIKAIESANEYWISKIEKAEKIKDTTEMIFEAFHAFATHKGLYNNTEWGSGDLSISKYIVIIDNEMRIHHAPLIDLALQSKFLPPNFSFSKKKIRDMILDKFKVEAKRARMGNVTNFCIIIPKDKMAISPQLEVIYEHVDDAIRKWKAKRANIIEDQQIINSLPI